MKKKKLQELQEYMELYVQEWPFSGGILIAREGEVLFTDSYGMANREFEIPNTIKTRFPIASLTKPFIGVSFMQLKEMGLIDLKDSISKYFSEYPELDERITIHHLLTNSSGITDTYAIPEFNPGLKYTPEDYLNLFKNKPLEFVPGERWSYSNSGFYLLGRILKKVSGCTPEEFIRKNILNLLEMKNSGHWNNQTILLNRAYGYSIAGEEYVRGEYFDLSNHSATGGMYSTLEDLLIFDHALYADKIISKESLDLMYSEHIPGPGPGLSYGYGWMIMEAFSQKMVEHGGYFPGFSVQMNRYLNDRVFIIILGNVDCWSPTLQRDLASIVFDEKYTMPKKPEPISYNVADFQMFVGKYESARGLEAELSREGDKFFFESDFVIRGQVYPISANTFQHIKIDERFSFRIDENGDIWLYGLKKK